jgi:hypothetical protein
MSNVYIHNGSRRYSPSFWACNTKLYIKKGADNHVADALSRKLGSPELVDVSETCDDIFPISLNGCRQWWTIMSRINSLMIWLLS